MAQYNLSFAGAGKVAGALCREFSSRGMNIRHIVSASEGSARLLADHYGATWSADPVFVEEVEVIIVAVPDHKLEKVIRSIRCHENTLVAHTAGSFGLEVFPDHINKRGVFYPLQTFSEERKVLFTDIPFFIEAGNPETELLLKNLAETLGAKAYVVDKENRKLLHLAAVFVCNFVNHMLTAGKDITLKAGLSFDVLEPLIKETISKAMEIGPDKSQSGPAIRNDKNTIAKHIDLLSCSPEFKSIYKEITESIIKYYKTGL